MACRSSSPAPPGTGAPSWRTTTRAQRRGRPAGSRDVEDAVVAHPELRDDLCVQGPGKAPDAAGGGGRKHPTLHPGKDFVGGSNGGTPISADHRPSVAIASYGSGLVTRRGDRGAVVRHVRAVAKTRRRSADQAPSPAWRRPGTVVEASRSTAPPHLTLHEGVDGRRLRGEVAEQSCGVEQSSPITATLGVSVRRDHRGLVAWESP